MEIKEWRKMNFPRVSRTLSTLYPYLWHMVRWRIALKPLERWSGRGCRWEGGSPEWRRGVTRAKKGVGGRIHHQSKSGIITERFITRGHRSVMPIHVCKPFLNISRTYICISQLTHVISSDGFSAATLARQARVLKNCFEQCAEFLRGSSFAQNANPPRVSCYLYLPRD